MMNNNNNNNSNGSCTFIDSLVDLWCASYDVKRREPSGLWFPCEVDSLVFGEVDDLLKT
jgi:hypothetical protein